MTIAFLTLDEYEADPQRYNQALDRNDELKKLADAHVGGMVFKCSGIDSECLLLATDSRYKAPTAAHIAEVYDYLVKELGADIADIEALTGYKAGEPVTYPTWRLMLSMAGLSIDLMHISKEIRRKILR
ncbi:hypothetical protein [Photobacterium kishitanii]|uniref:hypothetical protein n=1 Tax=Photobacterium kishitanii TaxID=318456 RepID=UPI000D16131D|nr:hypothetical protein [Photobacterium kishitanii]PSU16338.1 hypothetical protein CTM84_19520 [Photobacterium kishitanii]